jgi:glycosyltransferase involved in cell wall biosynthesis
MRIAIAASGLGRVTRGIEAWAAYLGPALRRRGEQVTVFRGAAEPAGDHERRVASWGRTDPPTRRLLRWLPQRFFWRLGLGTGYEIEQSTFAFMLLPHLRRERIDVLHVKDPQVALLVQRAAALGLVHCRTILSHGTDEPLDFLRKLTYVQHLAPWHLEQARAAGVDRPTWTAIPNFIDTELFHPGRSDEVRRELGIPADAQVVLSAAAIQRRHKRIDYLLEEFGQLVRRRPDLPAYLVVAGAQEADTEELIRQGQALLGERVRFLVNHPLRRMPELYRAADLFALASLREMLGTVLLEAAASGLPSLVHRFPVSEWVVGPGGQAIEMDQPGALSGALEEWLAEPGRSTSAGERARAHCEAQFSRERVVDQYVDYYRFVLHHGRARRRHEGWTRSGEARTAQVPL